MRNTDLFYLSTISWNKAHSIKKNYLPYGCQWNTSSACGASKIGCSSDHFNCYNTESEAKNECPEFITCPSCMPNNDYCNAPPPLQHVDNGWDDVTKKEAISVIITAEPSLLSLSVKTTIANCAVAKVISNGTSYTDFTSNPDILTSALAGCMVISGINSCASGNHCPDGQVCQNNLCVPKPTTPGKGSFPIWAIILIIVIMLLILGGGGFVLYRKKHK